MDNDFVLLEVQLQRSSQFFVKQRQHRIHGFHDGYFGSQHAVGDAQFQADIATTNHDNMVGEGVEREGFTGGKHVVAEGHEREFNGDRALGENDVLGFDEGGFWAFSNLDGLGVLEHRPTAHQLRTGVLQESFDTFVEAINNAFFPANKVGHVQFGWSWD